MSDFFESPLSRRYASREMSSLFSPKTKYAIWRQLWVALAESQKELGLSISSEQIEEMKNNIPNIDFDRVKHFEKSLRHDVMAHIKAFAEISPKAAPIIHLGATSAYVTDNGDLIQMTQGLVLIEKKLISLLRNLSKFAEKYASLPCLSYTHFQPAQPTTLGKRCTLWIQDFLFDFKDLLYRKDNLPFLGVKGATGTQAALKELLGDKANQLDQLVANKMGFQQVLKIASQTYPRKLDTHIVDLLASIAVSSHKMATDLRLLAHLNEVEEPFGKAQVGSSAMPYKRNPVLAERVCSISRFLIALSENPKYTAATQWLERTLDDSANRRLTLPEAFLAADAILDLLIYITNGLVVYPKMIEKHLKEELPFMAIENILMQKVKEGKNRQEEHENLRTKALQLRQRMKEGEIIDVSKELQLKDDDLNIKKFIGNAEEQVKEYLKVEVFPLLEKNKHVESALPSIEV